MPGDASDSSDDSDAKTNEKACTVKHQITNGKSNILKPNLINSLSKAKQKPSRFLCRHYVNINLVKSLSESFVRDTLINLAKNVLHYII